MEIINFLIQLVLFFKTFALAHLIFQILCVPLLAHFIIPILVVRTSPKMFSHSSCDRSSSRTRSHPILRHVVLSTGLWLLLVLFLWPPMSIRTIQRHLVHILIVWVEIMGFGYLSLSAPSFVRVVPWLFHNRFEFLPTASWSKVWIMQIRHRLWLSGKTLTSCLCWI